MQQFLYFLVFPIDIYCLQEKGIQTLPEPAMKYIFMITYTYT